MRTMKNIFKKLTKKTMIALLALIVVVIPLLYLFSINSKTASAAWFDDNWTYRKAVTVTVTTSSSDITNLETLITVDTTGITDKLQTNCEDLRFTNTTGKLLPYYIDSCSDNSATNKIWVMADLVPKNTTTYTLYMYYGNPSAGAVTDSTKFNLFNGLVNYWTMNESSWTNDCSTGTIKDSSVNANHGKSCPSATGPTGGVAGQYSNAGSFDGSNDYIVGTSNLGISGDFTASISMWVNPTFVNSENFVGGIGANGVRTGFNIGIGNNGTGSVSIEFMGGNGMRTASGVISAGTWYHVVATKAAGSISTSNTKLFVNGAQIPFAVTATGTPNLTNNPAVFGAYFLSGVIGGTIQKAGQFQLDDFRAYNRVLSDSEITRLYTNPGTIATTATATSAPTTSFASEEVSPGPVMYWKLDEGTGVAAQDATASNLDGTLNNTPTWATEDMCIADKCLWFDGTNNENISKSDNSLLDFAAASNFTVSVWVKRNGSSTANNFILTKAQSGYTGYKLYQDTSGDYCFDVSDGTNTDTACTSAVEFDDSQWHLVQGVKTGTTSITLYVDGKQRAQDASIAATGTLANTGTFYIGVDLDGISNEWLGFIDEVKVYPFARSAAQIASDFSSQGSVKGVSADIGSDPAGVLSNGLVGYWKVDETASPAIDSSGNGNSGTWAGNTDDTIGKFGNAANFDGSGDYISIADSTSLDLSSSMTVATWVKYDTFANIDNQIAGKYANAGVGDEGWILFKSDNNYENGCVTDTFCFLATSDGAFTLGDSEMVGSGSTVTTDTWYHVVGTYDYNSNKISVYVNGSLTNSITRGSTPGIDTNDLVVAIGGNPSDNNRYQDGRTDEARIYNRALSAAEVFTLYNFAPGPIGYWNMDENNGTSASDRSGNANTGTLTDGPTWTSGKYGSGVNFDGTDDFIDMGSPSTLDNLTVKTVEFWTKLDAQKCGACGTSGSHFINKGDSSWFIATDPDSSRNIYGHNFSGTSGRWSYPQFSLNVWHHVVVVYDRTSVNNNPTIYVDGVSQTVTEYSTPVGTTTDDSADSLLVSKSPANARWVDGQMDEVKIYNYARTAQQIVRDMNGGHPAPGSPIGSAVGHWKFDEGYSTTAFDSGNQAVLGSANNMTLSSASWTNSGKFGKAWNGTGALWVSRADDSDFDFAAADDMAISLWFKSDSATNPGAVEYLADKESSSPGYAIYANTDGTICFGIDDDATWTPDVASCTTADFYDGTWHHVVAVRNVALDKTFIYIDGLEKDSDSDTTTATLENSDSLILGDRDATDNGDEFGGDLDEVKIYRGALTASQISIDMNRSSSQVLGALSDNSSYEKQAANQEYCIPGDSTSCAFPVGEWKFDENAGSSTNDTSGNANIGTWNGTLGSQWKPGKIGSAGNFNGGNNVVNSGSGSSLDDLSSVTISAWIRPTATFTETFGGRIADKRGVTGQGWVFFLGDTNTIRFFAEYDGAADLTVTAANDVLTLNTWQHVTATWTGSATATTVKLYVNGKETSYQVQTNGIGNRTSDVDNDLLIGDSFASDAGFSGMIDNLKVYNYVRTPAQIAWDYNRGAPVAHWKFDECQGDKLNDSSINANGGANGNTGTLNLGASGATTPGTCTSSATTPWYNGSVGKYNSSLDFDGTDDYVSVANTISGVQTVSFWVKPSSSTTNMIALTGSAYITSSSGIVSATGFTSSTIYVNGVANGTLTADAWNHVAVTTTSGISASAITFGLANSTYLNGQLDDIRLFNYVPTATQIQALYNQGGAIRFGPATGTP